MTGMALAGGLLASLLPGSPVARAGGPIDAAPAPAGTPPTPAGTPPAPAVTPPAAASHPLAPTPGSRALDTLPAAPAPAPPGRADVAPARLAVAPVATPHVVFNGPRAERVVALTFDDGWNAGTLRQIYRILVREQVPATFFVTGIYVQRAPALWRQIAASGFPLANHSYLHRDARRLTPRQMALDLALTRQVVQATTGRAMLPVFRPPYGYHNAVTDRESAAAGFPDIVLWDATGADTARRPTVRSVVRHATAGRPGSIVLLHAGPRVTPRALPAIIAGYRARGFRFVTLPELLGIAAGPPQVPAPRQLDGPGPDVVAGSGPATATPAAGIGRVVAPPLPGAAPPFVAVGAIAGSPRAAEPRAAARDASWARSAGMPQSVALFTISLLALVLVLAAAAGRSGPSQDDPAG